MRALFVSILIILFNGTPMSAQSGAFMGVVVDDESGSPVSYVNVSVDSARYGTTSDGDGKFIIEGLEPGIHHIEFSRIGYERKALREFQISAGDTAYVTIRLDVEAYIAEEIVVTATRHAKALNLAPASAAVVTSDQYQQKQIQTFDQALDEVAGLVVTRSSGANVQSISIRGASETAGGGTGNRILLMIDGRPALSPESGGALWNLVPLNSIERIEVVKGAYSALFGSSAVGGVINAISKKPKITPETRIHLNYGAYGKPPFSTDYDTYRDFSSFEIGHSRKIGKLSLLGDFSRKQNDGHREKSGFTLYNAFAKAQYEFAPNRTLTATANFNKQRNDTPGTWINPGRPYEVVDFKKDDYQNKYEGAFDIYYSAITQTDLKYTSRFYYYQNFQEFTFNDDPQNDSTNVNIGKQFVDRSSIRTLRLGNISQVDRTFGENHYALVGIDVKFDKISAVPDTVLYGRHNAVEAGIFVQDEWSVTDKWVITAGVRADYYTVINEFSEFNFSPKVASVYKPNSKLALRLLWARAFRNAAIAERFIKFEQGGGLRFDPNPDLVSEKLNNSFEAGLNAKLFNDFRLDVSLYHNRYKDLISFEQISAPLEPLVFRVINLKTAVMQGIDFSLSYAPCDWFSVRAAYGFLDAKDTSPNRVNDQLAYKPKHTYSLATSMRWNRLSWYAQIRGRSEIEEVFIYPDSSPDAYYLVDTKLQYSIAPGYQFYFALNNITDTQYEELERYRMPGRSFSGGVVLQF